MQKQVSKAILLLLMMLPFVNSSFSRTAATASEAQNPSYAKDYLAAEMLQAALKENNRQAIADLISYPLFRAEPLLSIKNNKEFLRHWEEFFDATTTRVLLEAKAEQIGWRGISIANGIIWFDNGHIKSIYTDTSAYKRAMLKAIKRDSKRLYSSARNYDELSYQCSTKNLHVRVQKHGDDLRYFAWKSPADLLMKPELELKGGSYNPQGTGGGYELVFQNKGFTYEVSVAGICGEDCNNYLAVKNGDKTLSSEVCNDVRQ